MEVVIITLNEWLQRSIRNRFVKWFLIALLCFGGTALAVMEWHNRLNAPEIYNLEGLGVVVIEN